MAAELAKPVFQDGAKDEVLVGDAADLYDKSGQAEAAVGSAPVPPTTTTTPTGPTPIGLQALEGIDLNNASSVASGVEKLKSTGKIDALKGNPEAINGIIDASKDHAANCNFQGLEGFDFGSLGDWDWPDFDIDLKFDLIKNMSFPNWKLPSVDWPDFDMPDIDWPNLPSFSLPSGMMGSGWNLNWLRLGEMVKNDTNDDSCGWSSNAIDSFDFSGFDLSGAGDWVDDLISGVGDNAAKLRKKLVDDLPGEYLNDNVPRTLEYILKNYPKGYEDSYRKTHKEAHDALMADILKLKPHWNKVSRRGKSLDYLYYYQFCSPACKYVLAYDLEHRLNFVARDGI